MPFLPPIVAGIAGAIGGAASAIGGAASSIGSAIGGMGVIGTTATGAKITLGGMLLAVGKTVALGAAVGALGLLLPKPKGAKTKVSDIDVTTSIRHRRVPVLFGRGRLEGNYIALGGFGGTENGISNQPKVKVIHAVLGICEGKVQAAGNFHVNNQTLKEWARTFQLWEGGSNRFLKFFKIRLVDGDNAETVHPMVADPISKFDLSPAIPWRNTAQLILHTVVGTQPALTSIHADTVGPAMKLTATGASGESSPADTAGDGGYDGYSECFWYTLTASTANAAPRGLARVGRDASDAAKVRSHTAPPAAIVSSVTKAWYLGRHDLVCMQDPASASTFWFGYWGIASASPDWESVQPSPSGDYANAILVWCLDELHGILHTLHDSGTVRYVMRLNLLTLACERMDTDLPAATYKAMLYSPDFDAYWVASSANLKMVDPLAGTTNLTSVSVSTATCVGLCVSGVRVGVVTPTHVQYYSPYENTISATLGTTTSGLTKGEMGGTASAHQNTWTGHVTLVGKSSGGSAAFVNFFPSVVEEVEDVSALGTQGEAEFQAGTPFSGAGSNVTDWARDWSSRTYNGSVQVTFEGNSSVAAAGWASCVDEASIDSGRWGAGMGPGYFSKSAFESVHAFSVGAMKFKTPKRLTEAGTAIAAVERWAERAKFDYVLGEDTLASHLVGSEILGVVNGVRATYEGRFHPVLMRRGAFPVWHFTDQQITDPKLSYIGHGDGTNRIRGQFSNVRDEYRSDFAEANDEFLQNAMGRVQEDQISFTGIARYEHMAWLCKWVMDQSAAQRRKIEFKTGHQAFVLSPGAVVKVTCASCDLDAVWFRVTELREQGGGNWQVTAYEHPRTLDALKTLGNGGPVGIPDDPDVGGAGTGSTQPQEQMKAPNNADPKFFNAGSAWPAGTYRIKYLFGAYREASGTGDYFVAGYDIITRDATGDVVLDAAPGDAGGYATAALAEDASDGLFTDVTLAVTGPIGLKLQAGITPYEGTPTYSITLLTVA
jgi:hypothetical protein